MNTGTMANNSIKLITPDPSGQLIQSISRRLCLPITSTTLTMDLSNEITFSINETVRDQDVYIIMQIGSDRVNDHLVCLLIMIQAAKTASARKITVVLPNFPYARQDKRDRSRVPISAKLVADMITSAGGDHVVTMDLHASQIMGFFDVPVDNVYAEPYILKYIREKIELEGRREVIIVSPDAGGAKRAATLAEGLKSRFALIHKERVSRNELSRMVLVGDVSGKICVIVDDMADTCGTLVKASEILYQNGADKVIAVVTHGILSGDISLAKINGSRLELVVVTNTVDLKKKLPLCEKLQVIDISPLLAESIRRLHNGESVSYLYKDHSG